MNEEKLIEDMYEGRVRPDCEICDMLTAKARNGEISKEEYRRYMLDLLSGAVD
jgi:hypothetical protein